MQARKLLLLPAAASLLLGAIAHADDASRSTDGNASKAVYEGEDAQGRVVRLTISDISVETFNRVSPPKAVRYPEPHWSSRIGTGTAADSEH
jgi:hypothetical protein